MIVKRSTSVRAGDIIVSPADGPVLVTDRDDHDGGAVTAHVVTIPDDPTETREGDEFTISYEPGDYIEVVTDPTVLLAGIVAANNLAAARTRSDLAALVAQITPEQIAVPEHDVTVDVGGVSNYTVRCSCGYTCGVATKDPATADEIADRHVTAFAPDTEDPSAWLPEGPR